MERSYYKHVIITTCVYVYIWTFQTDMFEFEYLNTTVSRCLVSFPCLAKSIPSFLNIGFMSDREKQPLDRGSRVNFVPSGSLPTKWKAGTSLPKFSKIVLEAWSASFDRDFAGKMVPTIVMIPMVEAASMGKEWTIPTSPL